MRLCIGKHCQEIMVTVMTAMMTKVRTMTMLWVLTVQLLVVTTG